MVVWWNSLSVLGQILACIAIPSTLIMLIQIVMMFLGLGHSGDADTDGVDLHDMGGAGNDFDGDGISDGVYGQDIDADHGDFHSDSAADSGFRLLSVRGIIAFFAMFGWTGLVMLKNGNGNILSLAVALAAGLVTMLIIAFIFMWMFRLQSDGTMNIRNALGISGKVYLRVPAERNGAGKVNVMIQGTYSELSAVTDEKTPIQYGEEIVVIGISGENTLVVKRK
ncbi:MAG: hypothetical protein PHW77_00455 [Eubacteriales bacterium]|nr:hypothetical protein [Eubacteriales bacterium]